MVRVAQREDRWWTVLDPKGLALTPGLSREEAERVAVRLNRKSRDEMKALRRGRAAFARSLDSAVEQDDEE